MRRRDEGASTIFSGRLGRSLRILEDSEHGTREPEHRRRERSWGVRWAPSARSDAAAWERRPSASPGARHAFGASGQARRGRLARGDASARVTSHEHDPTRPAFFSRA